MPNLPYMFILCYSAVNIVVTLRLRQLNMYIKRIVLFPVMIVKFAIKMPEKHVDAASKDRHLHYSIDELIPLNIVRNRGEVIRSR